MQVKVTTLAGTPVFAVFSSDTRLAKIYGATRIKDDPLWYYPAFYPVYAIVLRDFKAMQIPMEFSDAAQQHLTDLEYHKERIDKRIIPKGFVFKTHPYEHQLEGFIHILYNPRAALFYACGLGKSKLVVDWQRATNVKPLILCPKVVIPVWAKEAQRHGLEQEFKLIDATGRKAKLAQIEDAKNYTGAVISYDSLRKYYEALAEVPYNAIVADESHYIKNPASDRTKAAIELSKKANRRILLSGTPSTGNPLDLWSQFQFLSPCFLPESFWKFKHTYCNMAKSNPHIIVGYKNLDVLNKRISIVTLRKTKADCLDLPERQIIDMLVELSVHQRQMYNTLIHTEEYDRLRTLIEEGLITEKGIVDTPNAGVLISKLMQITSGFLYLKPEGPSPCDTCDLVRACIEDKIKPFTSACIVDSTPRPSIVQRLKSSTKLDMLLQKLDEILADETHKCIVWAQFEAEMDWIQEAIVAHLGSSDVLVRVDGSTRKSEERVNRFNTDPKCRIYLGQVETGVGITLNAASYMIYFSLPLKLLAYDQSIDRNHRVGQTKNTTVFRFIARGTVDTHVAYALATKRTVSETLTATLQCAVCARQVRCESKNIHLFEPGCIYQRELIRPVMHARNL